MSSNKSNFFHDLDGLDYSSDEEQSTSGFSGFLKTSSAPEISKNTLRASQSRRNQPTIKPFRVIPESKQIFKGLKFFFVPNNIIALARKLRVQRSQEYGALWAQTWSSDVTHVIVDKGLNFDELRKVLTPEQLSGEVAIVNQDYPSDCLQFGQLLSVTQTRFRVDGIPTKATRSQSTSKTATNPESSPRIKDPRRRDRRSPTASQDEGLSLATPSTDNTKNPTDPTINTVDQPESNHEILDEMVQKVKSVNYLPLDDHDDDDDVLYSILQDQPEAEKDNDQENQSDLNVPEWQKNFTCMQKHDGAAKSDNPNTRTIEILQKMADYYSKTADNWRTVAYRKAIATLRRQNKKISTKAEALAIPGIGCRLADKIEEIVSTDRLRRLENTDITPEDKALQLFLGVYGAGYAQATRWVAKGFRSLEDLKTKAELSENQKIGVDRYYDFQERIPREEVGMHGKVVRDAVHAVDSNMEVIVAGSYRRGAADCGDIDVLITKPTGTLESIRILMLDSVIPKLVRQGFLKTSLSVSSHDDGSKWLGASALLGKDVWRRIDLLFVPGEQIGAALLYFTGNDIFNRSMRLLARKKGMRLNQRGLFKDVLRGPNQVRLTDGSLVEGRDEKQIFQILGVPWRPPEHRIC
ncbi:putative DNA polymerase POL4 [Talaromyces proteolyticus]|uniref:DNA polymerase n=1 Tax=Talaromyces proteolyticus TaxID=1131652 RepID=A0AAD4PVZ4_9EURO|nr:putative DNA polymerase POL4 [Talaromyces proteolyticus]KAH8697290.1 putative DNA polymerase POL4 [Talaromyces proteolyticus]